MSYPNTDIAGTVYKAASAIIGKTSVPTRLFNLHVIASAVGQTVNLRNGYQATDTIYMTESATNGTGATFDYGDKGIFFPDGLYIEKSANVTSYIASISQ